MRSAEFANKYEEIDLTPIIFSHDQSLSLKNFAEEAGKGKLNCSFVLGLFFDCNLNKNIEFIALAEKWAWLLSTSPMPKRLLR